VKGVVRAKAFMQFSDIRLKTNITDLVDAIHIVTGLQGKRYKWKNDSSTGEGSANVIGLIAQEVQRVLPEVVHEDEQTGLLSVSYAEILPVLIEAFKDFLSQYNVDKVDLQLQLSDLRSKLEVVATAFEKITITKIYVNF